MMKLLTYNRNFIPFEELKFVSCLWQRWPPSPHHIPGPWDAEPTFLAVYIPRINAYGIVRRVWMLGHLCGYIGLTDNHLILELNREEMEEFLSDIHGEITFDESVRKGRTLKGHTFGLPVAHAKLIKRVVGFDCAHAEDYVPGMGQIFDRFPPSPLSFCGGVRMTYKDIKYVLREIIVMSEIIATYCEHIKQ